MALDGTSMLNHVTDHIKRLGHFAAVHVGEPTSAPPTRTCAVWVERIGPSDSGLASTSIVIRLTVRVYIKALAAGLGMSKNIELDAIAGADLLMTAYNGDLTLGGTVMDVDIFGRYGAPLSVEAGYVTVDNTIYRIMDITLPLVFSDVYTQVA